MHIVFIVGSYYPYYSAVSKCVGNVAEVLSRTHKVTVICEKNYMHQEEEENYKNLKILRVASKEKQTREILLNKASGFKGIKRVCLRAAFDAYKLLQVTRFLFLSRVSIKTELVNLYTKKLEEIEGQIDLIIPASMPFESLVAADKYKNTVKKDVKIVPYLFDQFVDSRTLHRFALIKKIKRNKHKELENNILSNSHSIMAMHSFKKYFLNEYPQLHNINYVEHPLILENENTSSSVKFERLKISYIGGLYKNYVEPNYVLELFKQGQFESVELHFYIIGNCNRIVDKYSSENANWIVNHGGVDKKRAEIALRESDFLISIAENNGIQMSSKIFEYMSFGKPIIHFYTVSNDVNLKILEKYPLALCLKQDQSKTGSNIIKLKRFLEESYNKIVLFDEVVRIFPDATPEYTAELVETILKEQAR
ncbi:hypothetical protein D3P08_26675 [Paenibacillus nanensis]|uniref:Glycosyltransferase family 1 protein n=1 Tax=Paenibacillus nanensis TaxID=393251 RepID=A0A3A1UJQ6_9BACL|nr:hypothetical protein [Paenibacillus nanensis]RIX45868.1 hypothetical protein D3P08_26675 [Paenibacillus nanensis]